MATKIAIISQVRPKIKSQGVADLEILAARIARQSTTFDEDEMFGIFRKMVREIIVSLQNGETVKLDGLLNITPQMKLGGEVGLSIRADRGVVSDLSNPKLWTADKVINYANIRKTMESLLADWNENHPEDMIE
ncbi:MAG: hypothetical protein KC441_02870 [Anaerolineales bacterium]|nr:hypothetical protein [Anaerolineales bacterium]